ncbi:MAG: ParB/RepB/Spo0J family partition protein [Eubacteriales bacterium]|nr:ParB/RepB/Spo0J family partition protein [Eubacteriales bacterium]
MPVYSFQQGLLNAPLKRDLNRCLMRVPIDEITPNPNQPRRDFDKQALNELMVSIAQVGLIQPLTVRDTGEGFELIAGERRLRACKLLGMSEVPCIILYADEQKSAMMALIENVQRKELGYLEEAVSYQSILTRYALSQEELATRLGKSQSFLSNKLRLLKLSLPVRNLLIQHGLTERHARALLSLPDETAQLSCIGKIVDKQWTVSKTEEYIASELLKKEKRPLRVLRFTRDHRLFLNSIRMSVEQLRDAGTVVEYTQSKTDSGMEIVIKIVD